MYQKISQQNLNISGQNYHYKLCRKKRVKYLRLAVGHDGALTLTVPIVYPMFLINKFLNSRRDWIIQALVKKKINPSLLAVRHSETQIKEYKKIARGLVEERLNYFNQFYNFKYHRISIRNQSSRWGSCSSHQNLNFNYRVAILPAELADYIIAHELCHLQEMNHSPRFWQLVAKAIPDYKGRQKKLKKI